MLWFGFTKEALYLKIKFPFLSLFYYDEAISWILTLFQIILIPQGIIKKNTSGLELSFIWKEIQPEVNYCQQLDQIISFIIWEFLRDGMRSQNNIVW